VSSIDHITFHESGLAVALLECDGIMRSTDHGNSWTYVEIAGMASQNNIIFIDNDPKKILILVFGGLRNMVHIVWLLPFTDKNVWKN
jgi:hypothetical protein